MQEYYKAGLRVPDDVTLLWADDNWGDIRRLPTEAERRRSGGAGIYYHFDYVGGPRNYKWVNTNPIPKVWEQMTLAKEYGADRIWIVNVGHFKGVEFLTEYFMHLGWDTRRWTNRNIDEYTRLWTEREFGATYARDIAEIISGYTRYNGRRKPELLEPTTYSLTDYQEAERVVDAFNSLAAKAERIHAELPQEARDAFYQLVLFPTKACAQVNELYVAAGRNALYARQGRATANAMAARVETLFKADSELMDYYNRTFAGGKWNHFMDQVHIGYTIWQDPPKNVMPKVTRIELPEAATMGIAVEGSADAWPGVDGDPMLPSFDVFNRQRRYIDVFNRGKTPFQFEATTSAPWIVLSQRTGTVHDEVRLWVSVDWTKAPDEEASGSLTIARPGDETVTVQISALNPLQLPPIGFAGFVEAEGHISIEAEHFSRNVHAGSVRWDRIDSYGRTLSAMSVFPVTAPSATPPNESACLEYRVFLLRSGSVDVNIYAAPSLNFDPARGVRIAVSFDDEAPQMVEVLSKDFDARNGNREWEQSVKDACRVVKSKHTLTARGEHTLKIWMVDPAVVIEKIVVDLGGVKPSYLGPPESHRMGVR